MTVFLHIGFPKTATTALQRFFSEQRDVLGKSEIFYPLIDDDFKQRYLKSFLRRKSDGKNRMSKENLNKLRRLKQEIGSCGQKHILLSCEELTNELDFQLDAASLKPLANYIKSFGHDISLIAYVRNPVDYYLSRIQERLKSRPGIVSPSSYDARFSWTLAQYEEAFGGEINVRTFDSNQLVGGSIILDFFDAISDITPIDLTNIQPSQRNESLSAEVMFALDFLKHSPASSARPIFYSAKERGVLWRNLHRIDATLGPYSKPLLYPKIAEQLLHSTQQDVDELNQKYGIIFSRHRSLEHDSALPEIGRISPVEEIVSVDRERAFTLIRVITERAIRDIARK